MTGERGTCLAAQFERTSRPPARCRLPHARIRHARPMTRVQETWLRLSRSDTSRASRTCGGWLTTVTRVGLPQHAAVPQDAARGTAGAARARPGRASAPRPSNPSTKRSLADSVGLALLVVLETLEASGAVRPSSSMTCLPCRSTRSLRWSTDRRKRPVNWPAVPGAASRGGQRPRHGRTPPAGNRRRLLRRCAWW